MGNYSWWKRNAWPSQAYPLRLHLFAPAGNNVWWSTTGYVTIAPASGRWCMTRSAALLLHHSRVR